MKISKKIMAVIRRRVEIDKAIKAYDDEKKELSAALLEYMCNEGEDKAEVDVDGVGYAVSVQIRKGAEKISKEMLLERGVEMEVIKSATIVEKDSAPFVTIREVKEKKGRREE